MNTNEEISRILGTPQIVGLTICRLALATSMTYHGFQKLLPPAHTTETGVMAGLHYFAAFVVSLGLPPWLGYVSVFTEFVGGLLLIIGLFTRPTAAIIAVNMCVALVTVNARHGLASSEYTLALIAMALALTISGGGALSLDRYLETLRKRALGQRIPAVHLSALMFVVLMTCARPITAQEPRALLAQIVEESHSAGNFDGVVVIVRDSKIVLSIAKGEADRSIHSSIKVDTTFRLASLTKQVTALLIMQEVSAGRIRLDQPAGELLATLPPTSGKVTVRQLLQHVSGLPNPSDGPDGVIPEFYKRTTLAGSTKDAEGFCSGPSKREPGSQFEYNNCDYIILGAVLEKVTHQSFAQLVHERITQPLGLRSWGVWPESTATAPRTAKGYMTDGSLEAAQNPATYGAAGALYGNALDVAKWDEALLAHTLLSAEATEMMFHGEAKLYGEAMGSWSYDLPGTKPGLHLVERQGDIGGTRLINLLLPAQNAAIVIISNTERADLFDTYSRKGLGYNLAVALAKQVAEPR